VLLDSRRYADLAAHGDPEMAAEGHVWENNRHKSENAHHNRRYNGAVDRTCPYHKETGTVGAFYLLRLEVDYDFFPDDHSRKQPGLARS